MASFFQSCDQILCLCACVITYYVCNIFLELQLKCLFFLLWTWHFDCFRSGTLSWRTSTSTQFLWDDPVALLMLFAFISALVVALIINYVKWYIYGSIILLISLYYNCMPSVVVNISSFQFLQGSCNKIFLSYLLPHHKYAMRLAGYDPMW